MSEALSRPKVVVYQVASVDGRVAFTPDVPMLPVLDKWRRITGEAAGLSVDVGTWIQSTHHPQVYMEGSGSFVPRGQAPEPLPVYKGHRPLHEDYLPESVTGHPNLQGWGAVVDSRGRGRHWLRWVGEGWHILVLVSRATPADYLAHLRRRKLPYLVAGEERVNLRLALEKLGALLGVTCVCSTGGGRLNGALLCEGLVDEINLLVFPAVIGGTETPSLFDSPDLGRDGWPTRLRLLSAQTLEEGHIWLRYEVLPG
ncbi:MAG: deaminase [Chloroflexi bacterium]|nr:deaminase [Chloroflexota bacterium]